MKKHELKALVMSNLAGLIVVEASKVGARIGMEELTEVSTLADDIIRIAIETITDNEKPID